jgi:hypothetical protein
MVANFEVEVRQGSVKPRMLRRKATNDTRSSQFDVERDMLQRALRANDPFRIAFCHPRETTDAVVCGEIRPRGATGVTAARAP